MTEPTKLTVAEEAQQTAIIAAMTELAPAIVQHTREFVALARIKALPKEGTFDSDDAKRRLSDAITEVMSKHGLYDSDIPRISAPIWDSIFKQVQLEASAHPQVTAEDKAIVQRLTDQTIRDLATYNTAHGDAPIHFPVATNEQASTKIR
jgi:hypothetical protein